MEYSDIEEILQQWKLEDDNTIPSIGLYCPDLVVIKTNRSRIESETEFYLTILHEMAHIFDTDDVLSEEEIEQIAIRCYEQQDIRDLLQTFVPY